MGMEVGFIPSARLGSHRAGLAKAKTAALGLMLAVISAGAAFAADPVGDPTVGAKLFLQCRACHTVTPDGANGVGPNLYGVMGAKGAFHPGYKYSSALTASNITWTPDKMDAWLKKPTAVAPGTKMAFAGVAAPKARLDIIAYLATLAPPAKKAKR